MELVEQQFRVGDIDFVDSEQTEEVGVGGGRNTDFIDCWVFANETGSTPSPHIPLIGPQKLAMLPVHTPKQTW